MGSSPKPPQAWYVNHQSISARSFLPQVPRSPCCRTIGFVAGRCFSQSLAAPCSRARLPAGRTKSTISVHRASTGSSFPWPHPPWMIFRSHPGFATRLIGLCSPRSGSRSHAQPSGRCAEPCASGVLRSHRARAAAGNGRRRTCWRSRRLQPVARSTPGQPGPRRAVGPALVDVARFAESDGFEHDDDGRRLSLPRLRNSAFNADLPFDQFICWQLAGDEFAPDNPLAHHGDRFSHGRCIPHPDHRIRIRTHPLRPAR